MRTAVVTGATSGICMATVRAQKASPDQWRTMIDTKVTALVTITRRLLPGLIERRGGTVNIAAVAGTCTYSGGYVYSRIKAFLQRFTFGLLSGFHGTGIHASIVETESTLIRTGGNRTTSDKLYGGAQPMTAADIAATVPWIATLLPHVNANRLEIMRVSQSFASFQVAREEHS